MTDFLYFAHRTPFLTWNLFNFLELYVFLRTTLRSERKKKVQVPVLPLHEKIATFIGIFRISPMKTISKLQIKYQLRELKRAFPKNIIFLRKKCKFYFSGVRNTQNLQFDKILPFWSILSQFCPPKNPSNLKIIKIIYMPISTSSMHPSEY